MSKDISTAVMIAAHASVLRQCTECGQVWILADQAEERQPPTCPHRCEASVLTLTPENREGALVG